MPRRPTTAAPGAVRVLLAAAAVALGACGAGQAAAPDSAPPTVPGVGELPGELTPRATEPEPSTSPPTTVAMPGDTVRPVFGSGLPTGVRLPVGSIADGNRLLVIGDSIMASVSDRYGGQLCDRLVPLGWAVEVDAESGRDVTFGLEVLDDRLEAGWDAAVVMLGNNYRDDAQQFAADLETLVQRLSPRPVVLLTVTEFQASRAEVNYVVRSLSQQYANLRVVEWAEATRDAGELLGADGLHLSEQGRVELADQVADALLRVPGVGECLGSEFDDDSTAPEVVQAVDDSDDSDDDGSSPPVTPATVPPVVATTDQAPPPTEVTQPPSTDPPATDPPSTYPPTTVPPATDPPATDPPATDPPSTVSAP